MARFRRWNRELFVAAGEMPAICLYASWPADGQYVQSGTEELTWTSVASHHGRDRLPVIHNTISNTFGLQRPFCA